MPLLQWKTNGCGGTTSVSGLQAISGVCATVAWAIAWPLEVAKNKVQGAEGALYKGRSTLAIVRQVAATDGLRGLYRGILPGALRSFVANGAGMAVYQFTQSLRKD